MERILVLEDNDEMRQTLCEVLREEGYLVKEAASGQEAMARFHTDLFDLMVCDIRMEGMDGLDVLQHAKDRRPDVAGLVVTGYVNENDSQRALSLGVEAYLRKPFDLDVFLARVRQLLSQRRQVQQRELHQTEVLETANWALSRRDD